MEQRGEAFHPYVKALQETLTLLTKKPIIYVPDILFLFTTFLLVWAYLSINGLLTPLLHPNRIPLLQATIRTILQSTPSFITFLITTLTLLALNLATGITFMASRSLLIKAHLTDKNMNLFSSLRAGSSYFFEVFLTKLFLFLSYTLPLILLFLSLTFTDEKQINPYLFTLTLLVWFLIRFFTFFTYPILFLKEKSSKAFFHSFSYTYSHKKYTLLALLAVILISFFLNLFVSIIPPVWAKIAISTNTLGQAGIFAILYFIFTRIISLLSTLFEAGFSFAVYRQKKE